MKELTLDEVDAIFEEVSYDGLDRGVLERSESAFPPASNVVGGEHLELMPLSSIFPGPDSPTD